MLSAHFQPFCLYFFFFLFLLRKKSPYISLVLFVGNKRRILIYLGCDTNHCTRVWPHDKIATGVNVPVVVLLLGHAIMSYRFEISSIFLVLYCPIFSIFLFWCDVNDKIWFIWAVLIIILWWFCCINNIFLRGKYYIRSFSYFFFSIWPKKNILMPILVEYMIFYQFFFIAFLWFCWCKNWFLTKSIEIYWGVIKKLFCFHFHFHFVLVIDLLKGYDSLWMLIGLCRN